MPGPVESKGKDQRRAKVKSGSQQKMLCSLLMVHFLNGDFDALFTSLGTHLLCVLSTSVVSMVGCMMDAVCTGLLLIV